MYCSPGRYFGIAAATMAAMGHLAGGLIDIAQCRAAGGIGSRCNGADGLAYGSGILIGVVCSLRRQEYFWLIVFSMQGIGSAVWTILGVQSLDHSTGGAVGPRVHAAIVLVYSAAMTVFAFAIYRATSDERKIAYFQIRDRMQGFDNVWQGLSAASRDEWKFLAARAKVLARSLLNRRNRARVNLFEHTLRTLRLTGVNKERRRYVKKGKIRQCEQDLRVLYFDAEELIARFQLWVAQWSPVGDVIFASIKAPERAIQKTVRSYNREPALLTDLVRCSVAVRFDFEFSA